MISELHFLKSDSFQRVIKSMTDSIPISVGFFKKNTYSDGNSYRSRGSEKG